MTGASFDSAVTSVWGAGAGVGQYAGCGLVGCLGGVLFVVDGDAGEQGPVEDASFGGVALGVEVVDVVAGGVVADLLGDELFVGLEIFLAEAGVQAGFAAFGVGRMR